MKHLKSTILTACLASCLISTSATAEDLASAANDELLKCFDACETFFMECVAVGNDPFDCFKDKVECKRRCIKGSDKKEEKSEEIK